MAVVKYKADVLKAKQPTVGQGSGTVQDNIDHLLDVLIPSFGKVLVLLVGFALPCSNNKSTEYLLDSLADFHLGAVTNELCWCPSLGDVFHEGTGKIGGGHHYVVNKICRWLLRDASIIGLESS